MIITAVVQHAAHASQLWPTVTRVLTLLATAFSGGAVRYGLKNHGINVEVKSIVNGQFAVKVNELAAVTDELKQTAEALAQARAQLAAANHAGTTTEAT